MGVGDEEKLSQIRTIDTFDQIIPYGLTHHTVDTLTDIAKGYGLNDMHDAFADYVELGKHTKLTEIKDQDGEIISYQPEIKVNVDITNALEIQRQLTATMILLEAAYFNNDFKISWDTAVEPKGIFGATVANGFVTVEQVGKPQNTLDLIKIYADKLAEVQKFHSKQLDAVAEITKILKEAKDK